jgi:hypothetical protein
MSRYITGTIAQLSGKITMNGVALGQPELSVLTRIFNGGAVKRVGVIKKEGERGRPATIWQIDTGAAAFFECDNPNGLTASDDDAPEYVGAEAKAA